MIDPTTRVRGAARAATRPMRDYLNAHFEMTKEEIRRASTGDEQLARAVAELGNVIAETQLHHSRLVGELRDRIEELEARAVRSEAALDRLVEVVAASTLVAEADPDRIGTASTS